MTTQLLPHPFPSTAHALDASDMSQALRVGQYKLQVPTALLDLSDLHVGGTQINPGHVEAKDRGSIDAGHSSIKESDG